MPDMATYDAATKTYLYGLNKKTDRRVRCDCQCRPNIIAGRGKPRRDRHMRGVAGYEQALPVFDDAGTANGGT